MRGLGCQEEEEQQSWPWLSSRGLPSEEEKEGWEVRGVSHQWGGRGDEKFKEATCVCGSPIVQGAWLGAPSEDGKNPLKSKGQRRNKRQAGSRSGRTSNEVCEWEWVSIYVYVCVGLSGVKWQNPICISEWLLQSPFGKWRDLQECRLRNQVRGYFCSPQKNMAGMRVVAAPAREWMSRAI